MTFPRNLTQSIARESCLTILFLHPVPHDTRPLLGGMLQQSWLEYLVYSYLPHGLSVIAAVRSASITGYARLRATPSAH